MVTPDTTTHGDTRDRPRADTHTFLTPTPEAISMTQSEWSTEDQDVVSATGHGHRTRRSKHTRSTPAEVDSKAHEPTIGTDLEREPSSQEAHHTWHGSHILLDYHVAPPRTSPHFPRPTHMRRPCCISTCRSNGRPIRTMLRGCHCPQRSRGGARASPPSPPASLWGEGRRVVGGVGSLPFPRASERARAPASLPTPRACRR